MQEVIRPGSSWVPNCRVSVVIPTLKEAENLKFVPPRIPQGVHEVILIDGHSTDATHEVAKQLLSDIRIIMQTGRGKGNALRTGFSAATGDVIVMLDADGSTDPLEIPAFVGILMSGFDFAKWSRFMHCCGTADMPLYQRSGNLAFVGTVRVLFGGRYSDLCYGYNAFWKSAIEQLELTRDVFEIEKMMNVRAPRAGLNVIEVPSSECRRVYGSSRLRTIPDGWRVLKTIARERKFRPSGARASDGVFAIQSRNTWDADEPTVAHRPLISGGMDQFEVAKISSVVSGDR